MRIMVTGGGTGGHTSPALAVIEELRRRDSRLDMIWVGKKGNIEEHICTNAGIPFRAVSVSGWPRGRNPLRKLSAVFQLGRGVFRSWLLLRRFHPHAVLGVGGYVSLPLMYTAQRMGFATVIHEQNRLLGMANRLLAPRASRVLLSFPDTRGCDAALLDSAQVVGNPVRTAFLEPPSRMEACERFGITPEIPVVLVVGGSQGAARLNDAVMESLSLFKEKEVQLLWMTGPHVDVQAMRKKAKKAPVPVQVFTFIDDMAAACAAADLVVSRAGASTTAELAVMGKPSILVPYPHATDNHQEQNARSFMEQGAAEMLLDHACDGPRLTAMIRELLNDPERLARMGNAALSLGHRDAAERIADIILSLAFEQDVT